VRVRVSRGTSPCRFASRARAAGSAHILPPVGLVPARYPIPEDWKGRRVLLHFGAVDYRAMVWINGRLADATRAATRRSVRHHALAEAGSNTLTVRAEDPQQTATSRAVNSTGSRNPPAFSTPAPAASGRPCGSKPRRQYLTRVNITPSLDGAVRFDASIARPAPASSL